MSRKIMAAVMIILLLPSLSACKKVKKPEPQITTAAVSEEITEITSTTEATTAATTFPSTTVAETVTNVLTTVKNVITTKPTTTAVKTTVPEKTETTTQQAEETTRKQNSNPVSTRSDDKTYSEELRYGVIRRRAVTTYYEKYEDGTESVVKEDISEYYTRLYYSAKYEDLLPAAKENAAAYEEEINIILRIANEYRAEKGIAPLSLNKDLTVVACARAEEIAWSGLHSHYRPNGKYCFSIMEDAGITSGFAGENIGWGYSTAEAVCKAWKESKTHYENIMNPDFTEIGIGVSPDADPSANFCWSQLFLGDK